MSTPPNRRASGMSLIELLCAIVILAILLSLALPSFRSLLLSRQSATAHSDLMTSLNLARARAMTSVGHVVICPSDDHATCSNKVSWHGGWIVFQDGNDNNQREGAEPLIAISPPQPPGLAIRSTTGRTHVTFRPDGSAGGSNLTISFCDARGVSAASAIIVNNVGRPRIGKPTDAQAQDACAAI